MGSVIVIFKVMPSGVDIDLDSIERKIKDEVKPQRIERVPVAFGLSAIKVTKLIEEKGGELDRISEKISSIKGVKNVEVLEVTRSL